MATSEKKQIIGIDYGSKLAGTTVIASLEDNELYFAKSGKKKDADRFILDFLTEKKEAAVFLDAPLSLPGAYFGNGTDFFYRQCDRELKGMSPMFLGGLTARAIKLKSILQEQSIQVFEVYPGALARIWQLQDLHYKKESIHIPAVADFLQTKISVKFDSANILTWHHLDALLAYIIGHRFVTGTSQSYGDKKEGVIVV